MRARQVISVFFLTFLLSTPSARAQDVAIRAAVTETLAAWGAGDFETFRSFYHPQARGFFMDGGPMIAGFNGVALEAAYAAGLRTRIELSELTVERYGGFAVTAALLEGSVTLPTGTEIPGTWRYTETRMLDGGIWKIVQYHFSERAP